MAKTQNPNAAAAVPNEHMCRCEDCKKKPEQAGFCTEHYGWFKWGLITMNGERTRDFDKKYPGYLQYKKTA